MTFDDEIEDLGDLGQCICALLSMRQFGVKAELWDLLDEALSQDSYDGLKEVLAHWWEEQSE